MKVLILSNTAGQGHHATAGALLDGLRELGIEGSILDTYEYISPLLYEGLARGYLLSTSLVPRAYGQFYRLAEIGTDHPPRSERRSPSQVASSILSLKLKKFMNAFGPDVIVCTHVFSAQIADAMKRKGQLRVPVIGIVTDYTIHPFWQSMPDLDYVVTASELLTLHAIKRGIPAEKILPLGIPVKPKFGMKIPKEEARQKLGIDTGHFTVLLMGGSMGHGDLAGCVEAMDRMEQDFQILAVCGNNKLACRRISGMKTRKKVYCYGFVDNVDVMMDAADCIVTKPGGLTTSEAMAKQLPMLMLNPIPGQEDRNAEFMLNNGLAMYVTKTFPIDEALYQLFYYPEKLRNMESNIRLIGKPDSTRRLCEFIATLTPHENS